MSILRQLTIIFGTGIFLGILGQSIAYAKEPLSVGYIGSKSGLYAYPLNYALEQGWVSDVELKPFKGPSGHNGAFMKGRLDIGISSSLIYIDGAEKIATIVGVLSSRVPYVIVANDAAVANGYRGKSLGVRNCAAVPKPSMVTSVMVRDWVRSHTGSIDFYCGPKAEHDQKNGFYFVPAGGNSLRIASLHRGDIDMALVIAPVYLKAIKPGFSIVAPLKVIEKAPPYPLLANSDSLQNTEKKERIKEVLCGIQRASMWLHENPDRAREWIGSVTNYSKAEVADLYDLGKALWPEKLEEDPDELIKRARKYSDNGAFTVPVDFSHLKNCSF